jgi:hypothetical protein
MIEGGVMTHADDIDERRARALIDYLDEATVNGPYSFRGILEAGFSTDMTLDTAGIMRIARAIRLSDEAAGYILIKHEGVISAEGMKPKEGA